MRFEVVEKGIGYLFKQFFYEKEREGIGERGSEGGFFFKIEDF